MEKEIFEKAFVDSLNKNFARRSKYYDFKFLVFHELRGLVFEINNCLILEFHRATITLTNNLLERLLKLTLIYSEAGIGPKPAEDWGTIFEEPNRKYSSIPLGNSIEKCRKLDLITEQEKIFLFDKIRELMRNGFSHADSNKILEGVPAETTMYQASFANPTEIKPVTVKQTVVPFIQAVHIENFAKANAEYYFDFVLELMGRIENRLTDKNKTGNGTE
jgi:hypothetical protein